MFLVCIWMYRRSTSEQWGKWGSQWLYLYDILKWLGLFLYRGLGLTCDDNRHAFLLYAFMCLLEYTYLGMCLWVDLRF